MNQFTKTPLMLHQQAGLAKMLFKDGFALLMEQGTGKSLTFIEEALQMHAANMINAVFILAPNGVHENWILDQCPAHIPEDWGARAAYYCSNMNRKEKRALEWVTAPVVGPDDDLRIMAMSYDSLLTDAGWKVALEFVRKRHSLLIADESHNIKSGDASRTKRALNLRRFAKFRRIGTGTVSANSPVDVFSQFQFLKDGILGIDSLPVFRAEYCELLSGGHGLLRHIIDRQARGKTLTEQQRQAMMERTQIVAKDSHGRPVYKNLDRLRALIEPHSFRVLKEDCLELPPKTYTTRYFHLGKKQRESYDTMEKELRYILEDGNMVTASKLTAMGKLRQMTSGFIMFRDGSIEYLPDNPRIDLLCSTLEGEERQLIIWAQYKEEIRNIVAALRKMGISAEAVNGDVAMGARRVVRESFQAGLLQAIVAHPGAMGTGFTLTAAKLVIYYSNDFNLVNRLQSEDRPHRIGQKDHVHYIDFVAIDTKDDDVVYALQHKLDTSAMINGDSARQSRFTQRTER